MLTVYTDMCADLCHYGHFAFLDTLYQVASQQSAVVNVLVGIHSDETIASYKRQPIMTMSERCRMIRYHPHVSSVVADAPLQLTPDFLTVHHIDLVFITPRTAVEMTQMYGLIPASMLRTIPYTDGISTTDIIARVVNRDHARDVR